MSNRKSILLIAVMLMLAPLSARGQSELTNQRLFDTEPNVPDHYERRVAEFEAERVEAGRIVFLGNSITEGGDFATLLGDSTVVNRGISGDNTFGVLRRIDEVIARRPSKLFIMIGINDISKDIPPEVIADNCRQVIERVQGGSPGTQIFLQSLLPLNTAYPGFLQHFAKEYHVIRTNILLREVAAKSGVRFINLFPVFMDATERLDERLTYDGLHLNDAGYAVWVDHLRTMGYLE